MEKVSIQFVYVENFGEKNKESIYYQLGDILLKGKGRQEISLQFYLDELHLKAPLYDETLKDKKIVWVVSAPEGRYVNIPDPNRILIKDIIKKAKRYNSTTGDFRIIIMAVDLETVNLKKLPRKKRKGKNRPSGSSTQNRLSYEFKF